MSQNARKGRAYFKPGMSPAAGGITVTNPHLKRQDLADWTRAVNAARSALFPRRKQLHDLYDNIVLDAHVQSVLLARTSQVANRPLRWFTGGKPEAEGKEDVYKTVIATPWFHRFIEGAMSAVPYGTTVLELVMKAGEVHDVAVVPRANVAPEQGLILEDPYQYENGIAYREDPYWSRYLIEVGEPRNYGGLLVAAMYVLYKRGGLSNWAQYMEMFGMPLRKGTYNPYDDASRTKLTQALEQMGSASWIVLPEGSNVEFIATSNSSSTGSADLYDKNIERCNAEISKLFLGQTLTTESGKRGARSLGEVHLETKNDIAQADMRRMEFLLNYELRPRLVQLGYPLQNGEFHFYEEATMPATERITVDAQVARHVPIPDSYWYKTYGIPAPTAAELKAIKERKEAATPAALREHKDNKAPATGEGDDAPDEEDRAYTASLTAELDAYYQVPPSLTAASGGPKGVPPHIWDRIAKAVRSGEITADSVDPELMQWIADEFTKQLLGGDTIAEDAAPPQLTPEHQRQIQVFSGFKTNAELRKATDALYDANGAMVPWATFKKRILAIDQAYNVRYLQAEYNLAKANRSAIENWNEAQRMKDVAPFIRYSTVGDQRVREAHKHLNGIIKPVDDPFWDVWWPPNGWNCRCTVIPELSDEGGKPVPPDLVPPKTMFANNVGKNGVIFPKGHPYEEQASRKAKDEVGKLADKAVASWLFRQKPVPVRDTLGDVSEVLKQIMDTVMGSVGSVHLIKQIPTFSVEVLTLGNLGEYLAKERRMWLDPDGPWPEFTGVHEYAHHIDAFALGRKGSYATLAKSKSEHVERILNAAMNTDAYRSIRARLNSRLAMFKEKPVLAEKDRAVKFLRYLIRPQELFARAYAQYIAVRSGSPVLSEQLSSIRGLKGNDRFLQWPNEDFTPIATAFDDLFKSMGWNIQ